MGFLAPAVPWIVKGVGALAGGLASRKAQKSAQQRSPEELQALAGAQGAAANLGRQGGQLLGQGSDYLQRAGTYYGTLLGGNRAAMAQATAGPRAALTDVYRGAERGLERSNIQGAARDVAAAELGRERASRIASLVTGVQPGAAAALSGLGGTFLGAGGGLTEAGGNLYSNLLGQGFSNRTYARGEGEKAGTAVGSLITDILGGFLGRSRKPSSRNPNMMFGLPY